MGEGVQSSGPTTLGVVHTWVENYSLGDYASILSLFIALIGFGVTIYATSRSLKHSKNAEALVLSMKADLKRNASIHDFARVLALMEELKRLHREKVLEILPDRYSALRTALIAIRTCNPLLSEEEQKKIQGAITLLSSLERDFDLYRVNGAAFDVVKVNASLTRHIDRVHEVVVSLRDRVAQ